MELIDMQVNLTLKGRACLRDVLCEKHFTLCHQHDPRVYVQHHVESTLISLSPPDRACVRVTSCESPCRSLLPAGHACARVTSCEMAVPLSVFSGPRTCTRSLI